MTAARESAGPPGHWLTGNLGLLRRDILSLLEELPREYGDIVPLRFGGYRALLLSHPTYVAEVLVNQGRNFEKPPRFRRVVRRIFGNGVFAAEGTAWQQQRNMLQSALAGIDLQKHCAIVAGCAESILARWRDEDDSDPATRMMDLALAVRARTALGIDRAETLAGIHAALRGFMAYYTARLHSPLSAPLWVPTSLNRRTRAAMALWQRSIDDRICRVRDSSDAADHLLGRLSLRAYASGMSRRQLRDELATWLLTGSETTANTLAWTCYLLARHPEQHDRLLGDLSAAARDGVPPHDVVRVKRLGWVLAESMRLYPQAYLIGRKAKASFALDGRTFPRSTTVILNQWSIGRDPRWFERPLTFDPERWSGDLTGRLPPFAYFPFGGGARACLGRSLAAVELPLLLGALVQRFRFHLLAGADVRPIPSLTLRPQFATGALVARRLKGHLDTPIARANPETTSTT
jgi:cytochrome P450